MVLNNQAKETVRGVQKFMLPVGDHRLALMQPGSGADSDDRATPGVKVLESDIVTISANRELK